MKLKPAVLGAAIAASIFILIFQPSFFSGSQEKIAAVCLLSISFWATGIIPQHITALCFFVVCLVFSLARPEVVFSGFASSAVWLIFGGLVIGSAITTTGLGRRLGKFIAQHLHGSYVKIIAGLVAGSVFFSFLMPSAMSRVVLLVPISLAVADFFGFQKGRRGRTGIVLAVILGSFLPAFAVLPANVPNMVLIGVSENLFHESLLYGPYLLLHFPVLGLLKGLLIVLLIVWLFPDRPVQVKNNKTRGIPPLSRDERLLTVTLFVLLLLWMSDFLHHVSPAWVALAGAVFLMFPGVAVFDSKRFSRDINWASIIFVAGILGMGSLISSSGTGQALAHRILGMLPLKPGHDFSNYLSLSVAATATGVATTLPAMPAVFTQFSETLSKAAGIPVTSILNIQVLGFSTVLFPYQAPPIVVGMQLAGEKFSHATRICLIMAGITVVVLFPLDFLWWKLLDMI